jgi:hypothetical protein
MITIKIIKTTAIALAAAALATTMLAGSASARRYYGGPDCPASGCPPRQPSTPVPVGGISTVSGTCSCAAALRSGSRPASGTRVDPYRSFRFLMNAPTSRGRL